MISDPFKDKEGKTRYLVSASARNKRGKRFQRKRYATSYPEAKKLERELFREVQNCADSRPNITFEKFVLEYYSSNIHESEKSALTLRNQKGEIEKHFLHRWAKATLREINQTEIKKILLDEMKELSDETRRHLLSHLRGLFKYAKDRGYVDESPVPPINFKKDRRAKILPTKSQLDLFINRAREQKEPFYPIWHFLLLTGLRSGEAIALQWRNVQIEEKIITISESWTRRGGPKMSTKDGGSRIVPISPQLEELLHYLRPLTFETRSSYVLPRNREWKNGEASKMLKAFLRGLGLPEIRLHDLRACFITQMLRTQLNAQNGVDVPQLMRIVGHKRLETTLIYLGLAGLDVQGATDHLSFGDSPLKSSNPGSIPPSIEANIE